ncbi:SDR family oxidoreductase [Pseudonocardia lutea]|uniref:SDR family oxidoreductase n=1 Tax=Pseudonocardia lutea TaxID=2172015 RepID=A0ABW1IAS9_9PSEU
MRGTPSSIVITGASSGFGRDIATTLAQRGWRVLATMRDPGRGAELKAAGAVEVTRLDVTSPKDRARVVTDAQGFFGHAPDVVLHNAGYTTAGFFEDLTSTQQDHLLQTNLVGPLELTRLFLPGMRERGTGRIAVMSSNAANVPHPMYSIYAASKWALEGWAEALAIEVAPFGIDVVVFQPGNHDTAFGSNVVPVLPEDSAYSDQAARALPRMARLGRYARPAEKATHRMCEVLDAPTTRLRVRLGPDDHVAAWLARLAPYALRRRGVEWITGLGTSS